MLYNFNKETYKIIKENNLFKVYYQAKNRWSSGWAFIGIFKDENKAINAAKKYSQ